MVSQISFVERPKFIRSMWSLSFLQRLAFRLSLSWKFLTAIILPFVLLPLIFVEDGDVVQEPGGQREETKYKTLYVLIIMAVFWAFEIIPLPVTALLPIVLFPALGVQTAYKVSENYSKESTMIFLGGVIVALGVEYCGLHNRIALKFMNIIGSSPVQLLFGVMSIVALLSMWISATACVAILVPVVSAIIDEIHESPEILSNEEIRRLSSATGESFGAVNLNPGGFQTSDQLQSRRRSSSTTGTGTGTGNYPGMRKNTTVFGNVGLSSSHNHHRGSTSTNDHHDQPHSQVTDIYPRIETHSDIGSRTSSLLSLSIPPKSANPPDPQIQITVNGESEEEKTKEKLELLQKHEEKRNEIKKMLLFGMMYSANIGGASVITGTSPNKIFKEVIKPVDVGSGGYRNITFFTWMALNVPSMLINVFIAWIYLAIKHVGFRPFFKREKKDEKTQLWKSNEVSLFLKREYQKLGKMSFHEISVLLVFLLVVILWIFRDTEVIGGWGEKIQGKKTVGDSTSAMLGVILLFVLPRNLSFFWGMNKEKCKYEALLDWKFVTTKLPWAVVLLLGSGFALADASVYSGLSGWIGKELILLKEIPSSVLLLIVILITSIATEVVSSVACANILLPVIVSVSRSLNIHPLYMSISVALTCQYAFLFPIATPSNTIVFAAGNFSTKEMFKTGIFLNLICIAVLYTNTITYGDWLFKYSDYNYSMTNAPNSTNLNQYLL